ncbi:MAG: hypothetical protein CMC08_03805 [Flavobacteriaceae bacterium]|nr:hypothetical protein [Flavobacteriaceae bacterium]
MFNKPINNILKAHFNGIYEQAKEKAKIDYNLNVLSQIKDLEHFEALKFHLEEQERIKALVEIDEHPYYIKNHSTENWLLTQFASRYFLLDVDESEAFMNSVYLGEYQSLLFTYIHDSEDKIPKYTFDQFLNGKICKYYFSFEKTYSIERKDYYEILEWQSNSLIDIVTRDTIFVIQNYQNFLEKTENPIEFIESQFNIIEEELTSDIVKADELKTILSKLFLFKNFKLTQFSDDLLLENYKIFHGSKVDFKKITPATVGNILSDLQENIDGIIGNEYTIFYTIENLAFWLEDVINGKSYKKTFSFPVWHKVLEEAIDKGKEQAEEIEQELSDFAYNSQRTKDEIKKLLIDRFEEYRNAFNKFEPKEVFALIKDDNQTALFSSFKVNCFFNNDAQKYKDDLTEAVKINAVLWDVTSIYIDVLDERHININGDSSSSVNVMYLLHQMILDKEIYNELEQSMDDFMQHFHSLSLPFPVHIENQREQFARLFNKGISRLQQVLDDAQPSNKILYLQSRIKELKQREFKLSQYKDLGYSDKDERKYPKLLREFLDIEADFIKETSVVSDAVIIEKFQPKLPTPVIPKLLVETNKEDRLNNIIDKMQADVDARNERKIKDSLSDILDNLRGQLISSLQLYKIVKENTDLEKDALEYLKEDVGWYLFSMKMAQDSFYTEEQVERAFSKIKNKGYSEEKLFELGYLKNKKMFFDVEYEDPEEPVYIDKEKLLYPNEFTSIKDLLEIINKELAKVILKTTKNSKQANSLDDIIDVDKQEYILKLLEDLSITKNGKSILSSRKKGALRGVVEALREYNILPHLGIDKLCNLIADNIGLELKSKLDFSDTSQKFQKDAKQYIKDNPLH